MICCAVAALLNAHQYRLMHPESLPLAACPTNAFLASTPASQHTAGVLHRDGRRRPHLQRHRRPLQRLGPAPQQAATRVHAVCKRGRDPVCAQVRLVGDLAATGAGSLLGHGVLAVLLRLHARLRGPALVCLLSLVPPGQSEHMPAHAGVAASAAQCSADLTTLAVLPIAWPLLHHCCTSCALPVTSRQPTGVNALGTGGCMACTTPARMHAQAPRCLAYVQRPPAPITRRRRPAPAS